MNKTINFMMFVLGVAVGSVVTWRYVEKKYEQIAQDEIDSVKEVFSKRETEFTEDTEVQIKADNAKKKPSGPLNPYDNQTKTIKFGPCNHRQHLPSRESD